MDGNNYKLEEIFNFKEMAKLFLNFSVTTGYDVTLYDNKGSEKLSYHGDNFICDHVGDRTNCISKLLYSAKKSQELREPYIYEGSCGLIMCAIPVEISEVLMGSIVCGPIMLWEADELAQTAFNEKTKSFFAQEVEIKLADIPITTCEKLTSAVNILYLMTQHMTEHAALNIKHRKELETVNRKLRELNVERDSIPLLAGKSRKSDGYKTYPAEIEKEMIAYIQLGKKEKAIEMLNGFLGEIFSYASGDMNIIKLKLYEFFAFLSRATVENGVALKRIEGTVNKALGLLEPNLEFQDICILTVELINSYYSIIYENQPKRSSIRYLNEAILMINSDYMNPLSLTEIARNIGVSSYYLSHIFKEQTQMTFLEVLSQVRETKAKELLRNSDKNIAEIAVQIGFNETSSFNKFFKKRNEITPMQYRKKWK